MLQRLSKHVLARRQVSCQEHSHAGDAAAEVAHLTVGMRKAGSLGFLRLSLARVLVFVVPEVLRRSAGLVAAIPGRRGPGELQRHHDQQQVDEYASHGGSVSSVQRNASVAM